jgi:O-antigen/teichoic acid export membrane protein
MNAPTSIPPDKDHAHLERHMVRGSIWTIGVRWSLRLLGLISTVVLARLLTPADYGIVSISAMIVGMVDIFSKAGQSSAIVRHPHPTREHYDSAWTVSLILGFGLGAIIWALSPLTTAYFHEPRAMLPVQILAFRTMLAGSQNIGVLNFRRNLQFHKQFLFGVTPSIVSFVVTIVAAVILRNYWALIIGIMSEHVSNFLLSYIMEPYRPRISFAKVGEIWSFSFWTLFRNIGGYFSSLVDRIAIGGFAGTAAMGRYYVATDVATSPSQELVSPILDVLFPVMAKVQHHKEKRRQLFLTVLNWSAIICTSTGIGVALVADDMVDLVLGPQWGDVKPLMVWLALSYVVLGTGTGVYIAFDTIGKPGVSARLQWLRLIGLALAIFPVAYLTREIEMVAAARLAVTVLITPTLFYALAKEFDISLRDYLVTLWRPVAAGSVMAVIVLAVNTPITFTGNPRLAIDMSIGAITYCGSLMVLWQLSGRPEGPERAVWRRVHRLWLSFRS